jgi:hypothetical protein
MLKEQLTAALSNSWSHRAGYMIRWKELTQSAPSDKEQQKLVAQIQPTVDRWKPLNVA